MPDIPKDAPPSYAAATGSSTASASAAAGASSTTANTNSKSSHLGVPGSGSSRIPLAHRKSMEDEARPLPPGWVRQFDAQSQHQFFVDTTKEPPRSIWHHPYDDDEYLASLSSEERERLEQESMHRAQNPTKADIIHAPSDDEDEHHASASSGSAIPTELPPRPDGKGKAPEHKSFGRRFKDKMTGTTHEQRVAERKKREEREQQMYEQHVRIREGMAEAEKTGKPVHIGKDTDGRDVYVEPPGYGGLNPQGYSINPYTGGTYTTPNARYIRPAQPYGRLAYDGWDYNTGGYAPGYGGGYGPGGYGRPGYGYGRPGYGYGYGGSGMGMGTGLALGGGLGLLLGTSLLI